MRRFPVGITLAAAFGLAVLLGLGLWQMRRLAWKTDLLARIAALQHAPARPIGEVLNAAQRRKDVAFVRVTADCEPAPAPLPATYRYALRDGRVGWRLMSFCAVAGAPWSGVVLDRGLVTRLAGQMTPTAASFPAPGRVIGVLRAPGAHGFLDIAPRRSADGALVFQSIDPAALKLIAGAGASAAPYYLAVESEAPPPSGVSPAALPQDIPNNHFVYALTWFGLAGVLLWMWAALVIGRGRKP